MGGRQIRLRGVFKKKYDITRSILAQHSKRKVPLDPCLVTNCGIGPVYTWGRMEGWPELSKFEPIGWLHFFKSGPMGLYMGLDGTSTYPTCPLRWHGFGAKPSSPKGAIESRFLVARTLILGRMGLLRWIKQILTVNKINYFFKELLYLPNFCFIILLYFCFFELLYIVLLYTVYCITVYCILYTELLYTV